MSDRFTSAEVSRNEFHVYGKSNEMVIAVGDKDLLICLGGCGRLLIPHRERDGQGNFIGMNEIEQAKEYGLLEEAQAQMCRHCNEKRLKGDADTVRDSAPALAERRIAFLDFVQLGGVAVPQHGGGYLVAGAMRVPRKGVVAKLQRFFNYERGWEAVKTYDYLMGKVREMKVKTKNV